LRAPLRAIRSFAQILGEECLECGRPKAQEHIQRITNAAARMDKLILDVLQYSRLARSELRLAPVDVQGLLRGIVESYPAFQPSEVEIEFDGPLPRVLANEAALTQCFSNLLGNAIKFVAPGTRPHLRIWAEAGKAEGGMQKAEDGAAPQAAPFVRLWFADNGVGIPKDAQDRIFKMFQRLDKSYDGTGVGLTVVRKAVEKMGGHVGLESEPGKGSRFWVELRAADQAGTPGGAGGPT
jgi:signal transduction histidine kinase